MNEQIVELYQTKDGQAELHVKIDGDTVWLSQAQMVELFERDQSVISRHLRNALSEGEINEKSNMQKMHIANSDRPVTFYDLEVIISVGYRIKSPRGVQFRRWATQRLKEYLVQGYAINEKRLEQKQQEVQHLKTGIRILGRAIEEKVDEADKVDDAMLQIFARGLALLDDYDHEELDSKGQTAGDANYPEIADYLNLVAQMQSDFESDVFAKPKDESFESSVNQIRQSFDGKDLYPSIEEKAANLLYLIVKNHSFVDGNKRIAAACFLYFLEQNDLLFNKQEKPIISNEALASLTLFIASSKSDEDDTVKKLIVSILNRSK